MRPCRPDAIVFGVALTLVLTGCAVREARWSGETAKLAVYATQIPLYPGAKVEDAMGSESYGDDPSTYSEGMMFWFKVEAPQDKVVAWYDMKLTNAKRDVDDDGNIVYTLTPNGADVGEDMGVILEPGKIRVFEHTKGGKHKTA